MKKHIVFYNVYECKMAFLLNKLFLNFDSKFYVGWYTSFNSYLPLSFILIS